MQVTCLSSIAGWHLCSICEKAATYMCYTCTYSLCKGCIREASYFCVRGQKGFCETCYSLIVMIESNGEANDEKVGSLHSLAHLSLGIIFFVYIQNYESDLCYHLFQ